MSGCHWHSSQLDVWFHLHLLDWWQYTYGDRYATNPDVYRRFIHDMCRNIEEMFEQHIRQWRRWEHNFSGEAEKLPKVSPSRYKNVVLADGRKRIRVLGEMLHILIQGISMQTFILRKPMADRRSLVTFSERKCGSVGFCWQSWYRWMQCQGQWKSNIAIWGSFKTLPKLRVNYRSDGDIRGGGFCLFLPYAYAGSVGRSVVDSCYCANGRGWCGALVISLFLKGGRQHVRHVISFH